MVPVYSEYNQDDRHPHQEPVEILHYRHRQRWSFRIETAVDGASGEDRDTYAEDEQDDAGRQELRLSWRFLFSHG